MTANILFSMYKIFSASLHDTLHIYQCKQTSEIFFIVEILCVL